MVDVRDEDLHVLVVHAVVDAMREVGERAIGHSQSCGFRNQCMVRRHLFEALNRLLDPVQPPVPRFGRDARDEQDLSSMLRLAGTESKTL